MFQDQEASMSLSRKNRAAAVVAALLLSGCATHTSHLATHPAPHFFQVDDRLYRGGQPTDEGFRRLADLGVKTVISLRAEGRQQRRYERELVESLGMQWVSFPMSMYWRPSELQVKHFLQVARDPSNQPVFVHCRKGEDRTGALVAIYRVVRQDWSPEHAYTEARRLGLAGWNPFMREAILHEATPEYVQAAAIP